MTFQSARNIVADHQIENGLSLTGLDVAQALHVTLQTFLSEFDFPSTQTTPCHAWPMSQLGPITIGGEPSKQRDHAALTPQANRAGAPAIAIPCGFTKHHFETVLRTAGLTQVDAKAIA